MSVKPEFFEPIEGLRGVAAILVALIHLQIFDNFITKSIFVSKADLAVDLFFVISGFVIAHNYKGRLHGFNQKVKFVGRRFRRLYPLHFVMLLAYLSFEVLRSLVWSMSPDFMVSEPKGTFSLISFFSHFFLVQVFTGHTHFYNIPSWSISVEFYTYISFAILIFFQRIKTIIVTVLLFSLLVLYVFKSGTPLDSGGSINFILRGVLGFYIGVLVCLFRSDNLPKKKFGSLIIFCAYISVWLGIYFLGKTEFEICLPFLFAISIYFLSNAEPTGYVFQILSAKIFIYIGTISYSVYMIHSFLWVILGNILKFLAPGHSSIENGLRYFFLDQEVLSLIFTVIFLGCLILFSHMTFVFVENKFRVKKQ